MRERNRPPERIGDYADERYPKETLRILASIKKGKPDKGKKWISHNEHDRVLYGGLGRVTFVDTGLRQVAGGPLRNYARAITAKSIWNPRCARVSGSMFQRTSLVSKQPGVHTSVNAARKSACATFFRNIYDNKSYFPSQCSGAVVSHGT